MRCAERVFESGLMMGCLVVVTLIPLVLAAVGGCRRDVEKPPAPPLFGDAAAATSCVPVETPGGESGPFCLLPGQTAMLVEDAVVQARIPYNGDALYQGRVRIERGSMIVKPHHGP